MGKSFNWRKIETELEDIARKNGFSLDQNIRGDKIIEITVESPEASYTGPEINLTELAKDLAERLT